MDTHRQFHFTIPTDYTTKYGSGVRVRWTDGATRKYGVVVSSAYVAGTGLTTVTLATNTDYAIVATTIVGRYITRAENPEGYPHWFNYTPTYSASGSMTYTSVTTSYAKFNIIGKSVHVVLLATGTTGGTADIALRATPPVPFDGQVSPSQQPPATPPQAEHMSAQVRSMPMG